MGQAYLVGKGALISSSSSNNFSELVVHIVDDLAITVTAMLAEPRDNVLSVEPSLLKELNRFSESVVTPRRILSVEKVEERA
jgi:hypothetical protein